MTSKVVTSRQTSTTKFPGTSPSAGKHQPASQTKTSQQTSTTKFTGPAKLKPTDLHRQWTLVPTLQPKYNPQESMRLTDLILTDLLLPTDLCHLSLLTPAPLLYTGQEEIASLASPQMPVAICLTDLPWICTLRKGSYLMIQIRL